jgi:Ca2+-binding EF-hand superfamily protein
LPESSYEDIRKAFIAFDKNGDGRISTSEFKNLLKDQGYKANAGEIEKLIGTLDTNNNGQVDYTEFLAGAMRSQTYLQETNLKSAFEYFDQVSVCCLSLRTKMDTFKWMSCKLRLTREKS